MEKESHFEFTLDDGTEVTVNKTGAHTYDFQLKPKEKSEQHFTYNDEDVFTDEKEKALNFDQLNALRKFWLLTRNEE